MSVGRGGSPFGIFGVSAHLTERNEWEMDQMSKRVGTSAAATSENMCDVVDTSEHPEMELLLCKSISNVDSKATLASTAELKRLGYLCVDSRRSTMRPSS